MKILIRNYNDKRYVWHDAIWKNGNYYLLNNGNMGMGISITNIVAVKDDNRVGFVMCANCGELIENTPESIERHFAEKEAQKDCFKCQFLTPYGDKYDRKAEYTPNSDGTYKVNETYDSYLGCKVGFYTQEINSYKAQQQCVHSKCRRSGVRKINDVFVEYPNVFDKHLTVDTLIEKKYVCDGYIDGYFQYDLKCRGTLKAFVNDLGIVERFLVSSSRGDWYLYYSARYNKVFFADWNGYSDRWSEFVTETKYNQIMDKLSKLYEEANANE